MQNAVPGYPNKKQPPLCGKADQIQPVALPGSCHTWISLHCPRKAKAPTLPWEALVGEHQGGGISCCARGGIWKKRTQSSGKEVLSIPCCWERGTLCWRAKQIQPNLPRAFARLASESLTHNHLCPRTGDGFLRVNELCSWKLIDFQLPTLPA